MKLITVSVPIRFTVKTDQPLDEVLASIRDVKRGNVETEFSLYDGTTELEINDVTAIVSEASVVSETEYQVRYYAGSEFTPNDKALETYNRIFGGIFTEAYRSTRERFLLYRNDGEVVFMGSNVTPEVVTSEVTSTRVGKELPEPKMSTGKKAAKKRDDNW